MGRPAEEESTRSSGPRRGPRAAARRVPETRGPLKDRASPIDVEQMRALATGLSARRRQRCGRFRWTLKQDRAALLTIGHNGRLSPGQAMCFSGAAKRMRFAA